MRRMMGLSLAALTIIVGCRATEPAVRTMTRNEVYFGLSRPAGPAVTEAEFRQFVEVEVAARFPDGFTIVPAQGHWREADGDVVAEESRLLVLYSTTRADAAEVDELCRLYRERFGQEAVLKVSSPARVEFVAATRPTR